MSMYVQDSYLIYSSHVDKAYAFIYRDFGCITITIISPRDVQRVKFASAPARVRCKREEEGVR